ncbi:hypothetical protein [Anaerocolumna sp.]|uniref:hypothetical protein n=1 Tax=Anaerocolumna sp. TaxID=2041569 RepID=UPI0028A8A909|nr:hypothetical protein [Anaerocolumna sp.]
MKNKNCAAKTMNLKLTAIRSFLKYCSEEDFELRGIYTEVCSIKKVKEEKQPIVYLQQSATSAILSAYDTSTTKHRSQWELAKLAPNQYATYLLTGNHPLIEK